MISSFNISIPYNYTLYRPNPKFFDLVVFSDFAAKNNWRRKSLVAYTLGRKISLPVLLKIASLLGIADWQSLVHPVS